MKCARTAVLIALASEAYPCHAHLIKSVGDSRVHTTSKSLYALELGCVGHVFVSVHGAAFWGTGRLTTDCLGGNSLLLCFFVWLWLGVQLVRQAEEAPGVSGFFH